MRRTVERLDKGGGRVVVQTMVVTTILVSIVRFVFDGKVSLPVFHALLW